MLLFPANSSWRTWEKSPTAFTWLKIGGQWCMLFLLILQSTYLHTVWSFPVHITSFLFCVLSVPFCLVAISLIGSAFLCSLLLQETGEWFGCWKDRGSSTNYNTSHIWGTEEDDSLGFRVCFRSWAHCQMLRIEKAENWACRANQKNQSKNETAEVRNFRGLKKNPSI